MGELGLTYAQKTVDDKSNEIPAMQKLLEELDINGCMVVADALNCQKETAKIVVEGKGGYLLDAKGNQGSLKKEIEDYVQDEQLRKDMDVCSQTEKNRERIETRTAYSSTGIDWMCEKSNWPNLQCIGAIHIVRKIALNLIKMYKKETSSKLALSNIMLNCLVDSSMLMRILGA